MPRSDRRRSVVGAVASVALAAVVFAGLMVHARVLKGPAYWPWGWRRPTRGFAEAYLPLLVAALPLAGALLLHHRRPERVGLSLRLVMLSALLLILVFAGGRTLEGMRRVGDGVLDPNANGYFSDAYDTAVRHPVPVRRFLAEYPERMPTLALHPRTKPPGGILFYRAFLAALPTRADAATAAALAEILLATSSVPATFALVRHFTGDASSALPAAAALCLCPGTVGYPASFDAIYPAVACGLVVLWDVALRRGSVVHAAALGLLLWLTTLQTFNLLTLGLVFAGQAGWAVYRSRRVGAVPGLVAAAVGAFALGNLLMFAATGYNAARVLHVALTQQADILTRLHRPWPGTVPWDLGELWLAAGWVTAVPVVLFFARRPRGRAGEIAVLAVALPVTIALLGLIQAEVTRVWAFMLPPLMLPAGAELRRWTPAGRACFFASMWVLLGAAYQQLLLGV